MSNLIRFAAIGLNHGHVHDLTRILTVAGAQLVSFYEPDDDLASIYCKAFPQGERARDVAAIFGDESIHVVISAAVPSDRVDLAIAAMQAGKDVLMDKPGVTTAEDLRRLEEVQRSTKRIFSVCFGERFENRATIAAGDLVRSGKIGRVVQTVGLGPHRLNLPNRPPWFFVRSKYGGILVDLASHQIDQFLYFTGSTEAHVVASRVGNLNHPEYPELEDFGEILLQGDGGSGYGRVDWHTPSPLEPDGRLFILGTRGQIEIRKNIDIAGRPGPSHLFLANPDGACYVDCSGCRLSYGEAFLRDVRERTETAMTQNHCFLVCRLAIEAQANALMID